jgi:hypothetical protein
VPIFIDVRIVYYLCTQINYSAVYSDKCLNGNPDSYQLIVLDALWTLYSGLTSFQWFNHVYKVILKPVFYIFSLHKENRGIPES